MDPVHILKAERKWALSPQSQVSPLRYHRCAHRPTQSARPTLWWPEQPEKRAGLHYICSFRPSADRRQKTGSLTPHPGQDPLESWYPKRPPSSRGQGCSPDSDVKTSATSRPTFRHCTSTLLPGWDKSPMWHYPIATPAEAQGTFWGHQLFRAQTRGMSNQLSANTWQQL